MAIAEGRHAEVERVAGAVAAWAVATPHVRAVVLVGSQARNAARPDSDVDLVILSLEPASLADRDGWWSFLGPTEVVRKKQWGGLAERRLRLPTGLEVELGIVAPTWARLPLDDGTRRVLGDGARVLHDPDHLVRDAIASL